MKELIEKIKANEKLKHFLLRLMMHPVKTRPRWWLRLLQPFYVQRGKRSVVYRSVRKDLVPFRRCSIGSRSVVEDFSVLNNAVGDLIIGDNSRVGMGNTLIGPVYIGNHVHLAQHVVLSGLNHQYAHPDEYISEQGVCLSPIVIEDNVWIGANTVVLPGVKIGEHVVVGAGSVVRESIPAYSVCVGNPARVVKQYDFERKEWVKLKK